MLKILTSRIIVSFSVLQFFFSVFAQAQLPIPGAENTGAYLHLLKGKKLGLVANHSSKIHQIHLLDSLLGLRMNVLKVFCPEHGFRGNAGAGELVMDETDKKTGIPIISLYGDKKKPSRADLENIEMLVFDIQDVGVRFYTYISTLSYVMEACAETDIELVVLDRPNPNGHFVDGPVLKPGFVSFVGMHEVPLVHGMTIGEYAQMLQGENWLKTKKKCELKIIPCTNYSHTSRYLLPVKPSPNLPNMLAVYLYPSLGLFEGTVMSVGRGTSFPFQVIGHPKYPDKSYLFIPEKQAYSNLSPLYEKDSCFGIKIDSVAAEAKIDLSFLIDCYQKMDMGDAYFNSFFDKLAGNSLLRNQFINHVPEEEIRISWQTDLDAFKAIRKKYLLYPDFE